MVEWVQPTKRRRKHGKDACKDRGRAAKMSTLVSSLLRRINIRFGQSTARHEGDPQFGTRSFAIIDENFPAQGWNNNFAGSAGKECGVRGWKE